MKVVASYQENERFTVVIRGGLIMAHDRRFLCPFTQNESTLDDCSVIVQSEKG